MPQTLTPLGGHAIFLLLVQLALLLLVARVGSELVKRVGLPTVIGELGAGLVLGPTVLGHYAPWLFAAVFPHEAAQFHLLEVVGTLGMTLLLLLTGLETDVRLLKNLGRPALVASAGGMVVPFALGLVLGLSVPGEYVGSDRRVLFAFFLATAMSISAMPVIAKILVDLGLTKRNIGLVILSAGVVDDTVGWLVLSVIAGAASGTGIGLGGLMLTFVLLPVFLLASAFVLHPTLKWLMRLSVERLRTPDTDLVLILVTTFLCAAITEAIHVHAVFGAFIAGVVLHQVPRIRPETIHKLESFVYAALAPVFFGIVGLKVDLWNLGSGGGTMLLLVLAIATVSKLLGAGIGAFHSGLSFWESASIAVAMNARGAMGIVVASIGLGLGILSPAMFSIIIVVAVVTSFMAPVGLRLTVPKLRLTEDERRRILLAESKGAFDPAHLRLLIATSGAPSALAAASIGFALATRSDAPAEALHVQPRSRWSWVPGMKPRGAHPDAEQHLASLRALAPPNRPLLVHRVASGEVAREICDRASRGFDLLLLGASAGLSSELLGDVVASAPCHVAIAIASEPRERFARVLVPVDGSAVSRTAVELASRYCEASGAALTLAVLNERPAESSPENARPVTPSDEELQRISVVFRASAIQPSILRFDYDPSSSGLLEELAAGRHDLVVVGAENRAIQHRMFFGYEVDRLIRNAGVPVLIVVPKEGGGATVPRTTSSTAQPRVA